MTGPAGAGFGAYVPVYWYLAFSTVPFRWWMKFMPGRFKHVMAFAPLPELGLWVFIDAGHDMTEVAVVPDGEAEIFLAGVARMAVVRIACGRRARLPRWGYWCTAMAGHLVGLGPCALRPDSLYRQCLANGGVLIDGWRDLGPEAGKARTGTGG